MRIKFNINYHTVWGQSVFIIGSIPELGAWDLRKARELNYTDNDNWTLELELPDRATHFEYRYFSKLNGEMRMEEGDNKHHLAITNTKQSYYILDYWYILPKNHFFYSSAFTHSWMARPHNLLKKKIKSEKKILLKVLAPSVKRNESLVLCGNQDVLGNWSLEQALILSCNHFPEWSIEFDAGNIHSPMEYKFYIINNEDRSVGRWETGENRILRLPVLYKNETVILSEAPFREENPGWKCAGLSIPVFSLKSDSSYGIGDFNDLRKMVDWAKLTHQGIIQILPVNDTTMTHTYLDSYPYNSISIYAIHPLYIHTDAMGKLKNVQRVFFYQAKQKELNALPLINYDEVDDWKWRFFREIFHQEGAEVLASPEFIVFFEDNKEWLIPYAAYSYLRDQYKTPVFHQWKKYSLYNKQSIENLCKANSPIYKEVSLYYFLQFHAHKQLKEVRDYAHKQGVVLKGDIPIGISRESIEAWTHPGNFNMNFQAGAPPDDFSITGQNWGFPTYNWGKMEADNYSWWKKRFQKMTDFFDAYRIDHILGFFRIWQIPFDSIEGLLGYFYPALPLSREEIEHNGLLFRKEKFTLANIHEKYLEDIFGIYTSEVKQVFLDRIDADFFILKKRFSTQRQIQNYFSDIKDERSSILQNGLFAICNEILFIEDAEKKGYYHPRIAASSSYAYAELSPTDQYRFDAIYQDYFYSRHNDFWEKEALKHLSPIILSTDMLVCGEDLGMIPHSVPKVMHQLQILSLEIERMPKITGKEFTDLKNTPFLSVCTTSTHDMSTLRGWWLENKEKTQRYYNQVLHKEGEAPTYATSALCEEIIINHLSARSMLTIIPFQDWLSIDEKLQNPSIEEERINIPANPRHYWRYRMHITIEELLKADELNKKIQGLIQQSNRNQ